MDHPFFSTVSGYADNDPDRRFFHAGTQSLSYRDFLTSVERISGSLNSAGVAHGSKVALVMPNSTMWYTVFWAIVRIGAHPLPLDPLAGEWEIVRMLDITGCTICFVASCYKSNPIIDVVRNALRALPSLQKVVVVDGFERRSSLTQIVSIEDFCELGTGAVPELFTPQSDEPLMLACTSGSTGNPKVITVPHVGFLKSQKDMADYLGFCERDSMAVGMPLYHQGGFGMGLQMILNGGAVFYEPVFDPAAFCDLIVREGITVVQLTPTIARIILSMPDIDYQDFCGVRLCYFAGEVLPMEIAREFFVKRGIRVVNVIGSSETATMVVWDSDVDRDHDTNEFRALPFTEFAILDEHRCEVPPGETGTICVHTDAQLLEYYKNECETARRLFTMDNCTWFDTGDLGIRTAMDRVKFAGRSKRIIKRGANLVCPEESEAFLLTHPMIAAAAVTGEPHELLGEMIVAYIQPAPGCLLTRSDIVSFYMGRLAAYKIPDKMIFTDSIPHDIGKVQFKHLNHHNPERTT